MSESRYEVEHIACPCCHTVGSHALWAEENGYEVVKCFGCGLVYVNPRPSLAMISEAVKTGVHRELEHGRTAIARRAAVQVFVYRVLLRRMLADVWARSRPISWLDIGTGYGEFLEAVAYLAASGSRIEGVEPMTAKAEACKKRGLNIREAYLSEIVETYDYVSLINVFSHIPDFNAFLREVRRVLRPGGEFILETGNIADLDSWKAVPTELDLPDHLVFAGESTIRRFLTNGGFEVQDVLHRRKDTVLNASKNIVKKLLGRKVTVAMPYSSPYRSLLFRARLVQDSPTAS